jgi:uncharacterized damage-inducible protein DinB
MTRIARLAVAALLLPTVASAQVSPAAPGNPITASFQFISLRFGGWLQTAFDSIPASKYAYRPTPPQNSIGSIAQHLEDANYALCDRLGALKHARNAKDALPDTVKAAWPKDTLVARLRASFAFCDSAFAQLRDSTLDDPVAFGPPGAGLTARPARSLVLFTTDLAEHYSQLATYMRLIGVVPPSALPPKPRVAIEPPAAALSRFVGQYDLPRSELQDSPPFVLDVSLKDGALYLQPKGRPAARLWPETTTDFFIKEIDAQVTFMTDAGGAVTGLVLRQNGENRPARKVN